MSDNTNNGASNGPRVTVLAIGQSNIANHGSGGSASSFGRVLAGESDHAVQDPIAGASGDGGSVWPFVADHLRSWAQGFALVNVARGGTAVSELLEGPGWDRISDAIATLRHHELQPTHVIFHQGEKDCLLGTSEEEYLRDLRTLRAQLDAHFPKAIWIVCRASYRFGIVAPEVLAAQNRFIEETTNTLPGPDTDQLGTEFRRDDTHFSEEGLQRFAGSLAEAIRSSI